MDYFTKKLIKTLYSQNQFYLYHMQLVRGDMTVTKLHLWRMEKLHLGLCELEEGDRVQMQGARRYFPRLKAFIHQLMATSRALN